MPGADDVRRFAADLDALLPIDARFGVAVSGGPDSLALLSLAAAVRPGKVEAATVDHRLRPESAAEATLVGEACRALGVPHEILPIDWSSRPTSDVQGQARTARYAALDDWARRRGLAAVLTAHHADDQTETLLMRLARGSGLGGLAGVRASRPIAESSPVRLLRPLLRWPRADLAVIAGETGVRPVDDPSNRDPRHLRTRVRGLIADADWLDATAVAASAAHLADAEEALEFVADQLFAERASMDGKSATAALSGLPVELQRRVMLRLFDALGEAPPRGPDLVRALATLSAGGRCTLGGLMMTGGTVWNVTPVPPRRT